MKITMDSYRFYNSKNKVFAVSTYAGRPVRGVAKCNPDDTFSLEDGKMLAMARCNEKIAEKRLRRANRKFAEALDAQIEAERLYDKMKRYLEDSEVEYVNAQKNVEDVLAKIG